MVGSKTAVSDLQMDPAMYGRAPPSAVKNTDADLYDIFGTHMASKGRGGNSLGGDLRSSSPSRNWQSYARQGE